MRYLFSLGTINIGEYAYPAYSLQLTMVIIALPDNAAGIITKPAASFSFLANLSDMHHFSPTTILRVSLEIDGAVGERRERVENGIESIERQSTFFR